MVYQMVSFPMSLNDA